MQIPLVDVKAQYAPLVPQIRAAFDAVLEDGKFVFGPNVAAFEEEAAAYLGTREAIGVANGTDALELVLNALEVQPGDEVICPAFTFYATAEAIARSGATPVFADIDAETLNLDPAAAVAVRVHDGVVEGFGDREPYVVDERARGAGAKGERGHGGPQGSDVL